MWVYGTACRTFKKTNLSNKMHDFGNFSKHKLDLKLSASHFSPIHLVLQNIYERFKDNHEGHLAAYIPKLAKANPNHFGICIATVDGTIYEVGDSQEKFSIQSISKIFVYGLALSDLGPEELIKNVGVEPSGEAFNAIIFDEKSRRPFNPMINSGAIATTSLIKGNSCSERIERILNMLGQFAGTSVTVDQAVFLSEQATGYRNRAIANLELGANMIKEPIDEHLSLYFAQCSALVNARDLSIMAATLANYGTNPFTGLKVQTPQNVSLMLSVMQSCGMYDFSGEWMYRIGLPAKSGVSGGLIAVVPGLLGIGIFSPLLDELGNSVRGIQVCEALSSTFNLHIFGYHAAVEPIIRRFYTAAQVRSPSLRSLVEQQAIEDFGGCTHVYELQGNLFFSTIEQLSRHFIKLPADLLFVIFDCRHVSHIDTSIIVLLEHIKESLKVRDICFFITYAPPILKEILSAWEPSTFVDTTGEVLEWCEDKLIALSQAFERSSEYRLEDIDIMAGLSTHELDVLWPSIQKVYFEAGQLIVAEGEQADELFMLARGLASVNLKMGSEEPMYRRIGAFSAGIAFGEMCLFGGGVRSATIIAEEASVCYVMKMAKFTAIAKEHPDIHLKLLVNMGKSMGERLKHANAELRFFSA